MKRSFKHFFKCFFAKLFFRFVCFFVVEDIVL